MARPTVQVEGPGQDGARLSSTSDARKPAYVGEKLARIAGLANAHPTPSLEHP